jgi:RimJ/RimL family protein N-acetyltransferase
MSSNGSRAPSIVRLSAWHGEPDVTSPEAKIRLLTSADAPAYRDIRLEGLRQNPESFASTFEEERDRPLEWFVERIAQSQIFGAILAQALVGVVGLRAHDDAKQRHKATIWGMYVRREARKYGIGERLVDAAVAYASGHVEQLQLAVVTENQAARRLYAKAGYVEYGHQVNALKHGGRYYDDILMVKFLEDRSNQ